MKIKNEKEKVCARSRNQVLDTYRGSEFKQNIKNDFSYDRVEELYSSFYAGLDPRRRTEMADGGMVSEDRNAMANLSNTGFQKEYPRAGYYTNPYIQDSVEKE
jgi:hypothetical protein